jgi:hypothetical protein
MKPVSSGGLRSLARPSNLIAVVALVAALGGTAFAATKITGKDVKDNSLTGRDVRNHSLTKADFKGSVRGPKGPAGTQGSRGPTGPSGTTGPGGATNVTLRVGTPVGFSGASPGNVSASCAAGERAVGGGINVAGETDGNVSGAARLIESYPTPATAGATPTGWAGAVTEVGATSDTASAYVVCATP